MTKKAAPSISNIHISVWVLLAFATAVFFRFYQLDSAPPGLYRDEAFNGIDALNVLDGQHALIFPANNGREPLYIYLTAVFTALLGPSPLAVRLTAALASTLTIFPLYLLARDWFNSRVAMLAIWLWAITLWPVHLGRVGFRVILLAPFLALAAWLATRAFQQRRQSLWLLAGLVYGASFYTYLAVRFTPLLLFVMIAYLWWRGYGQRLRAGLPWFALGTGLLLLPLGWLFLRDPVLVLGRTGQVFIFAEPETFGELLRLVWQQTTAVLGLFFWRGDDILRHNPANRPLFDVVMAVPFMLGVWVCLRNWRRPAAVMLLLWVLIMLGPTFLAADAPHFLRVAGVLPVVVIFPAIGLASVWDGLGSVFRMPYSVGGNDSLSMGKGLRLTTYRKAAVILILSASALLTARDYVTYAQQPDTGYLFESAARELAEEMLAQPPEAAVFLQKQLADGWPSVPYLLQDFPHTQFDPTRSPTLPPPPFVVYRWPFNEAEWHLEMAVSPPVLVAIQQGALSRGDLEPEPYPLYVKTAVFTPPTNPNLPLARFENGFLLHSLHLNHSDLDTIVLTLTWEMTGESPISLPTAFLQIVDDSGLIGQLDAPPGQGFWLPEGWQAGIMVQEQRRVELSKPFSPQTQSILVGLYDPRTAVRYSIVGENGEILGDAYELQE